MSPINPLSHNSQEHALEAGLPRDEHMPGQGPVPTLAANKLFASLDPSTSVYAHILKLSSVGADDPALRIIEVRPVWATYMLQVMSMNLKQLEGRLAKAVASNDPKLDKLHEDYFPLLREYYSTCHTIKSLERTPTVSRFKNMDNLVGHMQCAVQEYTSPTETEDLKAATRWVSLYDLRPNQIWTRALIYWASQQLGPSVRRIFREEPLDAGSIGIISKFPAAALERMVSGGEYFAQAVWFCVPVGILALVHPSTSVMVGILFCFVLSAAFLMSHAYPDSGHGFVFTIGYAAILSTVIFG